MPVQSPRTEPILASHVDPDAPRPVERVEPAPAPEPPVAGEVKRESMMNFMQKKFAAEERVEVKLRNDGDVFVSVNGYSFLIKPGVKVMVPKSLVPLLEAAEYI